MIELKHITKIFTSAKTQVKAVRDVSLEIRDGEIYGIIGFSGAGKSTLVRCINLLERPTQGTVEVDGEDLTGLTNAQLRRARKKIGMIFQHFNLLPSRTVFENIAYPLKGEKGSGAERAKRVRELLELVDLKDKENAYPSQLSGGQKQRVAIARALANHPSVLLCDEATSALDPQTAHAILQLLKRLNRQLGITIVLITHQMEAVKEICDRVAVMETGRVAEEGDVFSVFAEPKEEITREFIRSGSSLYRIQERLEGEVSALALKPGDRLVRLSYRKRSVSEALVSEISRRFYINVNIIFSEIELIQDAPLGGLVAVLSGTEEGIEGAVRYLLEKEVKVEVIEHDAA